MKPESQVLRVQIMFVEPEPDLKPCADMRVLSPDSRATVAVRSQCHRAVGGPRARESRDSEVPLRSTMTRDRPPDCTRLTGSHGEPESRSANVTRNPAVSVIVLSYWRRPPGSGRGARVLPGRQIRVSGTPSCDSDADSGWQQ